MHITYNMQHVFHPGASEVDNSLALNALLEGLILVNMAVLRAHPSLPPLYRSGVVYGRTTIWEPIPALYARGYGDCKSLTCARVAEDRLKGIDTRPVFRFIRRPNGKIDFHILKTGPGGFEDPSRTLGMDLKELRKFYSTGGQFIPSM